MNGLTTMTLMSPPQSPDTRPGSASAMMRPVSVAVLGLVGAVVLYTVDPNQPGHYPLCPFRALTGLDCPGCGATRGLHDLLHGDVVGALDHNVLLLGAVPVVLLSWLAWTRRAWTGSPRRVEVSSTVVSVLVVLILVFWVVRNIPGVPFLSSS